jgi:[ribosomal protein S5]-alanine N-acetyltransferase
MGRFYVYDMSEYLGKEEGWEIPEDGLYECIDFKKYWEDESSFPFLVCYQNEIVGFVIIYFAWSQFAVFALFFLG